MIYDIAIIGSGPCGLFVPFIAGLKKLSCITFESLDFIGGQCASLYPEKPIYDIPGHPKILAGELINNLLLQSKRFNNEIKLNEEIIEIKKEGEHFFLKTNKNNSFKSRTIVIATGGGKFIPNRPPLEGIENFEGKSVFYSVQNKNLFKNKKVAIAGGGDSAVDWALSLSEVASKIYFIHRRENFKASPESVLQMKEFERTGKIEFIIPYQLKNLKGDGGALKSLIVTTLKGDEVTLEVDFLLPFFGLQTDASFVKNIGIELYEGLAKVEKSTMQTSIKGIFAIGDIAHYEGKLKLILAGFSEGATAVYEIKKLLKPEEYQKIEHSTNFIFD